MSAPLSIFLGYDPREHAAYEVADFSIRRRSTAPLLITPMVLSHLGHLMHRPIERRDGKMWDSISQAPMSTEFAVSRFAVPFLQRTGWALFADSDILCFADVADLFALADPRYAVQVVKHAPLTATGTKMDGQQQTAYSRKNWSSVVLWNCGHSANVRFTADIHALNTWSGRDLHAFRWLDDDEIGALPQAWNWLVGVTPDEGNAKLLHFTLGGPWFPDWCGGPCDDLWLRERCALTHPSLRP